MADIIDPWGDVANQHKIRIYSKQYGGVTGLMPEQFNQTFTNTFTAPFADIFASLNTGVIAMQEMLAKKGEKAGADFSAVFKEVTTQIWKGGSPLSTTLRLKYISRRGANEDVQRPVARLIQMSAATIGAELKGEVAERELSVTNLNPPDPVMVEFGYILRIRKALITSLSIDWSNITDEDGVSVMADVQMGISTRRVFVAGEDEVNMALKGFETVGVT